MTIKKIKLVKNGVKGMNIKFDSTIPKQGYDWVVGNKTEPRYPIHMGLKNHILDLREYALELSNYFMLSGDSGKRDYLIGEVQIQEITFGEAFSIKFTMNGIDKRPITIETPEVYAKDAYANYEAVIAILEAIQEETEVYLSAKAMIDEKQLAMDLAGDADLAKSMEDWTDEERKEWCTKELTKLNCIVVPIDDSEGEMGGDLQEAKETEAA